MLSHTCEVDMNDRSERNHRLLLLWLDLQQALQKNGKLHVPPWESTDKNTAQLWEKITRPQNQVALEEWLFQVAPGPLERWAQQALLECRKRGR